MNYSYTLLALCVVACGGKATVDGSGEGANGAGGADSGADSGGAEQGGAEQGGGRPGPGGPQNLGGGGADSIDSDRAPVYRAIAVPDEQLWITKADYAAQRCIRLSFLRSPIASPYGISSPGTWGPADVTVSRGAEPCGPSDGGQPEVSAVSATGILNWPAYPGPYPCSLDVDVALVFDSIDDFIPTRDAFSSSISRVEGACQ